MSAWDPELTRFRELTAGAVATAAVGVGLVEAGIGTARCVMERRPAHVVFLGTCGSLAADLAIGDVVVGASVLLAGGDLPAPMPSEMMLEGRLEIPGRPARIVTTVGVTTSDARAAELAILAHVEHLEAFSFARACKTLGVDCTIVLGVANPVGSLGRASWLAHHEEASARAAEALAAALGAFGPST